MHYITILLLLFCILHSKTPYELGKDLYVKKACYSCHGNKLEGLNQYPHLANRAKGYMNYKLKYFKSGKADTQQQEMMIVFAQSLSDDDIENLTTYMYEYVEEESAERYDDSFQAEGDGGS